MAPDIPIQKNRVFLPLIALIAQTNNSEFKKSNMDNLIFPLKCYIWSSIECNFFLDSSWVTGTKAMLKLAGRARAVVWQNPPSTHLSLCSKNIVYINLFQCKFIERNTMISMIIDQDIHWHSTCLPCSSSACFTQDSLQIIYPMIINLFVAKLFISSCFIWD